jgi:type II secretory pathway pseudopilin PulG
MRERANTLLGLLFVILIVGVLYAIYLGGGFGTTAMPERADKVGRTTIGRSAAAAKDVVCRNNLQQIRMAIQVEQTNSGNPTSLADLPGFTAESLNCPIGHEPYTYDASTGKVTCPHPGHESY